MKKALILDLFGVLIKNEVPDDALVALARELKGKGMKLFLISNADETEAWEETSVHTFIEEVFDKFYYAGQTGLTKPDARSYQLILTENSLTPEDCVYFDEKQANIDVAQGLGIESHLFTSAAAARQVLLQ